MGAEGSHKAKPVWRERQEFSVGLNRLKFGFISIKLPREKPFNIPFPDIKMFAVIQPQTLTLYVKIYNLKNQFHLFADEVWIVFFFSYLNIFVF